MEGRVVVTAHAKVNLHLEVLGPRGDGFHDLVSLLQAVELADTIGIRRAGRSGAFRLRGRFPFGETENLVARAVAEWRSATGISDGLEARVEKRIPIAAGLGGGSSDAAAVLLGLEALFAGRTAGVDLAAVAERLGSDVPFFLGSGPALAEGRGERLRSLPPRTDYVIVAVTPAVAVSTAEAFRWLDEDRGPGSSAGPAPAELARRYREDDVRSWPFTNSFDAPVMARMPAIAQARETLLAAGAGLARLTGSGSTVIAVFADAGEAAGCADRLAFRPPPGCTAGSVRLLRPLDSSPVVVYYG